MENHSRILMEWNRGKYKKEKDSRRKMKSNEDYLLEKLKPYRHLFSFSVSFLLMFCST